MENPPTYVSYGDFGFKGQGFVTPYVSRTQTPIYYGVRSGQITQIDLNGQITGANYNALITAQNKLVSGFSKDFQSLNLRDGSTSVEGFPISNCIVDSINFSDSQYNQLLDYSISLRAYEASLFSGVSKVLNPVNSFVFSESSDGQRSITHTISAQGINTNPSGTIEGNALNNAKDFVLSLTGWSNQIMPEMIRKGDFTKYTNINPSLKGQSESVNRMDGTFSVTEDWVFDENNSEDAARTVTVDIQSGINADFVTATVNVSVQGDKRKSIKEIRDKVPRNNELYKIAKDNFEAMRATATRQLNSQPSSINVDEDAESKTINVSAVFSDNDIHPYAVIGASNKPDGHPHKKQDYAYFDYSVDLNRDEISSVTDVSINGTVVGIGGDLKNRYAAASQFLTGLNKNLYATGTGSNANVSFFGLSGFLYEKAKGEYDRFFTSADNYSLNQTLQSLTISSNEFLGSISLSATFNDSDKFIGVYNQYDAVDYNVSVRPSIPLISSKSIVSSSKPTIYRHYDLGVDQKTAVSISCDFQASKSAFYSREDLIGVAKKDAYNLRRALKEKYVDNEAFKKTGKTNDSSDFIKVESDEIEYTQKEGSLSLSSSYSFNPKTNHFVKSPSKLGSSEDPLTDPLTNTF